MSPISFFVSGLPKTAGSKRVFPIRKDGVLTGRFIVTDMCKGAKDWKAAVKEEAMKVWGARNPETGPLRLTVTFLLPRPKGHLNSKGGVKPSAPPLPVVHPDVDKLSRAILDSLSGIIYRDDSQVTTKLARKRYTQATPGAQIDLAEDRLEPTWQRIDLNVQELSLTGLGA